MKIGNITINGLKYRNYILISNIEEYKEYFQILNNKFKVSESEIKNNKTWVGHGHSVITGITGVFCGMIENKNERQPMLDHLAILHGKIVSDQLKIILDGYKLAINDKGGYFPIKQNEQFEFEEITDNIYSESDIKINKWYGGKHYYAKIGKLDVVDENGNVKWNTEKEARKKALEYLKTM